MSGKRVIVAGAGPAGLMAADILSARGHAVTIYDSMPSPARKFLLAGRGGLNLTHSEAPDIFLIRYPQMTPQLRAALQVFDAQALRSWADALGEPTFTGSSGRVFPKSFKASPLLRAWLRRLA
ncbi:MAG: NAD(P)/FAD-dependent oxidoreductase, partial [Beijerinckiaceae bacterium]